MKYKIKALCIFGALLGIILSRVISEYYKINGHAIIATLGIIIALGIIITLLFLKLNQIVLLYLFIIIPLVISVLGIYDNNIYLIIIGLVLLVICLKISRLILKRIGKSIK